ncbi:hypothetical protein [Frankia sp. Cr1]|uniref:hypothetical protein n=1 Tax=Frankia sp. Cr1 TaxID=3073931 RepID=UPI002AD2C7C1|nr:hypothetical protein [Frankia sp. Cr1]
MKPLMYGYLRIEDEVSDDEITSAERQMKHFAEVEGFCYATTFFEYQTGSHAAFDALGEELRRAEARHVIVPSIPEPRTMTERPRPKAMADLTLAATSTAANVGTMFHWIICSRSVTPRCLLGARKPRG